ncbi:MAG: hypothetical protein R3E39_08290 [Anaerolineae bacterium]
MTAVWTLPHTWSTGELATAALLNQHLRDNLDWLKAPPVAVYTPTANASTTSTSFVSTGWQVTLNSAGGGFFCWVRTVQLASTGSYGQYDIEVDGVRQGAAYAWGLGLSYQVSGGGYQLLTFNHYVPPLSAGSHTFKLMFSVSGTGSVALQATAPRSEFGVREI